MKLESVIIWTVLLQTRVFVSWPEVAATEKVDPELGGYCRRFVVMTTFEPWKMAGTGKPLSFPSYQ